jgi:hypothetical protein
MRHLVGCALIAMAACGGRYHIGGSGRADAAVTWQGGAPAEARGQVIAYLVDTCHADPYRREHAADLERRERERRLNADAEQAARLEADALHARSRVRAYLVALGAKERPPKPAPQPEVPGEPPYSGAEWIAGDWRWEDTEWMWIDGSWSDREVLGDAGGDWGGIGVGVGIGAGGGVARGGVRDHRAGKSEPIVRDHRAGKSEPIVRDHRAGKSEPIVRDHRDGRRGDPPLVMSDHRGGRRDDSPPIVRDHREPRSEPRESKSDSRSSRDSRSSKSKPDDDDDEKKSKPRDHRR